MTPEKRERAVKWLTEEIRSLRMAPKINGCGPENWQDQLEIMETCLEAVRNHFPDTTKMVPLTVEQLREMDGKPAWIVPVGAEDWESHWDVMRHKRFSADSKTERGKMYFLYESSYGSRWIAYSYPPAHIDREVWVSVYDRLPEPGERVLATDCGFVGEFYINKRGKWQRYNVNCSELLMALDILYWMSLPAPPTKET